MHVTFADLHKASRPRARREAGPRSEGLESRRMLDASANSVFPDLGYAIGLPVISLETGSNLAAISATPISLSPFPTLGEPVIGLEPGDAFSYSPDQSLMAGQPSVSLPVLASLFPALNGVSSPTYFAGPSATGPAPTLNPLGTASETAVAAASTVTRATPGFTDRISSGVPAAPLPIVPLPHFRGPNRDAPSDRGPRPAPIVPPKAAPDRPPIEATPATPERAPAVPKAVEPEAPVVPRPVDATPEVAPSRPESPTTFEPWDTAIDLVEADLAAESSAPVRVEESMAIGALMAAWGGLNVVARREGRSGSRPITPSPFPLEAGPGNSDAH